MPQRSAVLGDFQMVSLCGRASVLDDDVDRIGGRGGREVFGEFLLTGPDSRVNGECQAGKNGAFHNHARNFPSVVVYRTLGRFASEQCGRPGTSTPGTINRSGE